MENKFEKLIPEATYHVYNRANGDEKLFLSDNNYIFFLNKYRIYISEIADTWCYCLMPNHFHFLIRIKKEKELYRLFFKEAENPQDIEEKLSQQFSNFFNSYSKAFNKQQNRKGNLFMRTFKRKKINDLTYLQNVIRYIHYNPVEALLSSQMAEYSHSSYHKIISNEDSFVKKEEILDHFGGLQNFIDFHEQKTTISGSDFINW